MPISERVIRGRDFFPLPENNAVGLAGQELRTEAKREFENSVKNTVFWASTFLLVKAKLKLWELSILKSNWDSYGAPTPNGVALRNATRILELLRPFDLALANIMPSAEGGIGICFAQDGRYADIELSNDGEILGVRYVGMETPVLIDVDKTDDSIKAALQEIRDHMGA